MMIDGIPNWPSFFFCQEDNIRYQRNHRENLEAPRCEAQALEGRVEDEAKPMALKAWYVLGVRLAGDEATKIAQKRSDSLW